MRSCRICGNEIAFRWIDGRLRVLHPSGGCSYYRAGDSAIRVGTDKIVLDSDQGSIQDLLMLIRDSALRDGLAHVSGLFSSGESYTYPTRCWFNGCEPVIAHSNGFGDFVLLDLPLGKPWQVHRCYELRDARTISPVALLRDGQIGFRNTADANSPPPQFCGFITSVGPPALSPPFQKVAEISDGLGLQTVTADYWRTGVVPGRMVWLIRDIHGHELVPVDWESREIVAARLQTCVDRITRYGETPAVMDVTGMIIGAERSSGTYLVANEDRGARIVLHGEKPSLLWLLTDNNVLVPVLVKIWYGDERIGRTRHVFGEWRQLGTLWCLLADRLDR